MRNQFLLVIGLAMGSCLPAAAQTSREQIFLAQPPSGPMMLLVRPPPHYSLPTVFLTTNRPRKPHGRSARISAATYAPERSFENRFSILVNRTPFLSESSVPIAQLWGGRLQLEGFDSTCQRYPQFELSNVAHDYPPPSHDQAGMYRSVDLQGVSLRFQLGQLRAKSWVNRWLLAK